MATPFRQHLVAWRGAFMMRFRAARARWPIYTALGLFLLEEVGAGLALGWGQSVLGMVVRGWVLAMGLPIRFFGLLGFLVVVGLMVYDFFATRPRKLEVSQRDLDEARQQLSARNEENNRLESQLQANQLLEAYGCRSQSFPALSERDQDALRNTLQEWVGSLSDLVHAADVVRVSFWTQIAEGKDAFLADYAKCKYDEVFRRLFPGNQYLLHLVFNTRQDVREMLLCFYEQYRGWIAATVIASERAGVSLATVKGFPLWLERDAAFWDEWDRKLKLRSLKSLMMAVGIFENEHGGPPKLPGHPNQPPTMP